MIRGVELEEQDQLPCLGAEAPQPQLMAAAAGVCGELPSPQPGQKGSPGPEPGLFEIIFLKTRVFSQAMLEDP